jgi:hypothetical protein
VPKAKATSLLSEIKANIPSGKVPRWYERVAPEHQATLAEIRRAYKAGELGPGKKPVAKGIARYLNDHGISTVGYNGVENWLEQE